ncbi:HNH endonuclease [Streptomyces sp. cg2]|uniref:HNH endonuclease n=1 Tax=Streptomyces sp. cg2 TaxID=3238799 RepID=UPI0034E1D44E
MFTDFDDEPFRPVGAQHIVCGAIPAGFGVRVYVDGAERHPNQASRELLQRYPNVPKGLRTIEALTASGLRPPNPFRPDAYVLGPPREAVIPGHVTLRGSRAPDWTETVYRPAPIYQEDHAVAIATPPDPEEMAADRRIAADWAQEVLDDQDTVILAVNAIGSLTPTTAPLSRATPYEIALTSATGRKRWHRLVNPQWDTSYLAQIDLHGATLTDLEEAPGFRDVRDPLMRRLSGKRVVTYGRNMQYAAMYTALEYAWLEDSLPEGAMWPDTANTLAELGRSRWECAHLRHAEFENEWDPASGHYALPPLPAAGDALQHCRTVAMLLQRMARPALRYAELNARAEQVVREGGSHSPRTLSGVRLGRIAASRQAVLERSGGACENPRCPAPRYTTAFSRNGTYLLEVDHIDDHARGGEDLPRAMIALCPNCHAIKTRGTVPEEFREMLRATALANHQSMLADARKP